MRITCLVAILLLIEGCIPLTEQEREAYDYRRDERLIHYLEFRENCEFAGGRVHIRRWGAGSPRNRLPNPGDIYTCIAASRTSR